MESSASCVYGRAKPQHKKENFLDDVIRLLRRLLGYCLCVVTCGCVPPPSPNGRMNGQDYETALSDTEREAVNNLLKYLDSKASDNPTIDDDRLRALCILTYSDNVELQRSAALCFAEISERSKAITAVAKRSLRRVKWFYTLYDAPWVCHSAGSEDVATPGGYDGSSSGSDSVFDDDGVMVPLTLVIMEPLNVLLQCRDTEVLRAASLAVSNFALEGSEANRAVIVESGSIPLLVNLLSSKNYEVQCNVCGCITTLATDDENKVDIIEAGASKPLLNLCRSPDLRVQRNAVGAVLNLTHLYENRDELVAYGAIPILVEVQNSKDVDVQYYSTAALSNLGISERHRTMMVAVGHCDVVRQLITLAQSPVEKVRCQACLALRNIACDTDNQLIIVRYDGLPALKKVLVGSSGETLAAVTACVRNLSVHKANEVAIICESFLPELQMILMSSGNPEAQKHAAGTIRNLSAGDHARVIVNTGNIETLCILVLRSQTRPSGALLSVIIETTAALAILADEEEVKHMMLEYKNGQVISKLIDLANRSSNSELRYNCAGTLGQIAVIAIPSNLLQANSASIVSYMTDFLSSDDSSFVHIALWTLVHLLDDQAFLRTIRRSTLPKRFTQLKEKAPSPAVQELAETVIDKLIATDTDGSG